MLRILGSRLVAVASRLVTRVMSVLRNACRPSSVAGGVIADLTRSRGELIAENAFLRQQLIVASRGAKRPSRAGVGGRPRAVPACGNRRRKRAGREGCALEVLT